MILLGSHYLVNPQLLRQAVSVRSRPGLSCSAFAKIQRENLLVLNLDDMEYGCFVTLHRKLL
ncbi:hypothetical protein B5F79_10510 [Olsenella sp. An285]|nr:hypothetical protein B5F79_10510 [Olsenella sp. An285]